MTVRVTVHPGEDIELSDGVPPGEFRTPLAALVRRPELRHATFLADGVPVPEDCGAGQRPLLPGTTLTVRTRPAPADRPDDVTETGDDTHRTPGTPRRHLRRLRHLVHRLTDRLARHRPAATTRALSPPRRRPDGWWPLGLLPVVASVGLAIALRQPILAIFALTGLAAVIPQFLRRRGTGTHRPRPHRGGPDALRAFVTAARTATPATWQAARTAWAEHTDTPPGWPGGLWDDLLADRSLAVLGPEEPARAVARAIVADLAVRGHPVHVLSRVPAWTWCRWLDASHPTSTGPATDTPVLVVDHGSTDDLAAARRRNTPDTITVVIGAVGTTRTVLTVHDTHLEARGPDIRRHTLPRLGVTTPWAEHLARHLAGARHLGRTVATLTGDATPPEPGLPDTVPLHSLHQTDAAHHAPHHDRPHHPSHDWAIPLGRSATGPVTWNLVTEGPHLLIAGTTGSGKSELLRTLVLGLTRQHPPSRLALGLIDFKGGAGLGTLTHLPHVTGQVTDLDPALAERALAGLHAELRRRKSVLAHHHAADLTDLDPSPLPRLVIVVDEFRALTDELPEFVPGLVRIAAQGRSLGVHLVLATQRPAGAVSADVRANVTARLALRVTDPLESRDIVDCPDAAHLPVNRPGRAILRVGTAPAVRMQCAHTGAKRPTAVVRRAAPFRHPTAAHPTATHPIGGKPPTGAHPTGGPATTDTATTPRHAHHATNTHDTPPTTEPPLWLPPLPERITPDELATHDAPAPHHTTTDTRATTTENHPDPRPGLPIALGDLPEQQRRTVIRWNPADGNLAILGPARSGRSTALAVIADAALSRHQPVHAAVRDGSSAHPLAALRTRPGMTVSSIHDLPDLLATDSSGRPGRGTPELLLIDDVDLLRAEHPGWQPPADRPIAFAGSRPGLSHVLRAGPRLVLLTRDRADDVASGAPATLAGTGGVPGRAAWCGRAGSTACQVAIRVDPTCGNYL